MTQVRLQSPGDARGELAMGLLGRRLEINGLLGRPAVGLLWPLLGPWAIAPEHPLERHAVQPLFARPGHDHPCYIRRKLLALRPLLDRGLADGGTDLCGELAVRQ